MNIIQEAPLYTAGSLVYIQNLGSTGLTGFSTLQELKNDKIKIKTGGDFTNNAPIGKKGDTVRINVGGEFKNNSEIKGKRVVIRENTNSGHPKKTVHKNWNY